MKTSPISISSLLTCSHAATRWTSSSGDLLRFFEANGCFPSQDGTDELKKRVAVAECQLRKSEAAKKSFEMSTGKLLSFVEVNRKVLLLNLLPAPGPSSPRNCEKVPADRAMRQMILLTNEQSTATSCSTPDHQAAVMLQTIQQHDAMTKVPASWGTFLWFY